MNINGNYYQDKLLVRVKKFDSELHAKYVTEVVIYTIDASTNLDQIEISNTNAKTISQGALLKLE